MSLINFHSGPEFRPPNFIGVRMLKDVIVATEARMKASLAESRAKFAHSGLKGGAVECAVRDFLRGFIPRRLDVGTGEMVDLSGARTAQTDIVIANEDHPFTFSGDEPGLFFVEGVSAGGEVKSVLTSAHLDSTIEASRRWKRLASDPGKNSTVSANHSDLERFYRTPPYFLLALESQLSIEAIHERLKAIGCYGQSGVPRQIDGVFVLDKGSLIDCGAGDGSFGLKEHGNPLQGWGRISGDSVLFNLLAWLTMSMPKILRYEPILARYLVQRN